MIRFRWLVAALVSAMALPGAPAGAQEPDPPLAVEPYVLRGFDGVETAAEMGRIVVPADRGDPGGGEIALDPTPGT